MADKPILLSEIFVKRYPNDSICAKINAAIPDASVIVSVVHEKDPMGNLLVTVYYLG